MTDSETKLKNELREDRKKLQINGVLTLLTFLGLCASLVFKFLVPAETFFIISLCIAFLAGGLPATFGALRNLYHKKLDINLLMVLAAAAAAAVGQAQDGAILLFLFSLSSTLEEYAMGNTKRAVAALMKLRPDTANIQTETGQYVVVPVNSLSVGQVVVVKPGERIPIDGKIIQGESAVDQSPVTGESVPVDKNLGDTVFAGSLNGYGVLRVEVTVLASSSTLSRMIELVTQAQSRRSPSERWSDWFGHWYTILVLVGSVASLGGFILAGIATKLAFYKAATLLVVASPCAIVISVPAAVLSALAASAKQGVLFKGGASLEVLGNVDIIAFDKTGTLTQAKMQVSEVVTFTLSEQELLTISVSLESQSEHPLSISIIEYGKKVGIFPHEVEQTRAVPGKGISAQLDGVSYFAGNRKMLTEREIPISDVVEQTLMRIEAKGETAIIVGSDTVLGIFGIKDAIRSTALQTLTQLRESGIKRVVMLTGDNTTVAHAIGAELGISPDDIYADLLPQDKVTQIASLRKEGIVAFVGDGVNDAAALATAHVGIAMGAGGSDVALEAADVALLSDDMRKICTAHTLAQRANKIIKQNLIFATGILLLMVVTTIFFYLPLPLGVIGHEGGTLLVVLNGLRLLRVHSDTV